MRRLELDMPDHSFCLENNVVPAVVDLRLEYFDPFKAMKPHVRHDRSRKYVLEQHLTVRRMNVVFRSHLPNHLI